jgi:hypothetical protein
MRNLKIFIGFFSLYITLIGNIIKPKPIHTTNKVLDKRFKKSFKFEQRENVNPSTDCTVASISSREKSSPEDVVAERDHSEDAEFSDIEEIQKPPKLTINNQRTSTTSVQPRKYKRINSTVITRVPEVKAPINEHIEGWLEKKSKSLFNSWKRKYCQLSSSQFICFKKRETGLTSMFIDFNKVLFKITVSRSSHCFM